AAWRRLARQHRVPDRGHQAQRRHTELGAGVPMRALILIASSVLAACAAERVEPAAGQVLLHFDTDAPLPVAGGAPVGYMDPLPLFDRVRIEVYAPGEDVPCAGCTNEFAIDIDMLKEGRASIGIVPPANTPGHRARVRMFLAALRLADGLPVPDATVDVTIFLPAV